jgi:hypothetical protein
MEVVAANDCYSGANLFCAVVEIVPHQIAGHPDFARLLSCRPVGE